MRKDFIDTGLDMHAIALGVGMDGVWSRVFVLLKGRRMTIRIAGEGYMYSRRSRSRVSYLLK